METSKTTGIDAYILRENLRIELQQLGERPLMGNAACGIAVLIGRAG
jgi:hypothetical protein